MTWTKAQLENLREQRQVYRTWIEDVESGTNSYVVEQKTLGELVDTRDQALSRWKRNVEELERILSANGVDF